MLYDNGKYSLPVVVNCVMKRFGISLRNIMTTSFMSLTVSCIMPKSITGTKSTRWLRSRLHQATENFLRTITLVFTLYGYKDHDLEPFD